MFYWFYYMYFIKDMFLFEDVIFVNEIKYLENFFIIY